MINLSNSEHAKNAQLFEGGNFTEIALSPESECWQYYAAIGLIGVSEKALAGLSRFDCEEARFYTGATLWIQGKDSLAEKPLETCSSVPAKKLLALIRKPRIDVLAQVPLAYSCQYVPDFTDFAEDRFRIKNISPWTGPCSQWSMLSPPGNIHEYVTGDFRPDFFICREVEWQPIPLNLHELDCPVFGHTEDYDAHLQSVSPLYSSFSKIITCGSYEWNELTRMLSVPVCTFPKAYGLRDDIPEMGSNERDIDLFLSGTVFHPFHPDKAKLVYGLLAQADESLKLKIVSKHLPHTEYYRILGRTKMSLPYVRLGGGSPTRGLESLAMGNALIVQKSCVLSAHLGEEDGVFICDYWNGELLPLIEKLSRDWPDIAPCALRGSRRAREEFSMKRVTSEYLRFLTVMAAISHKPEKPEVLPPARKRSVISIGTTHDANFYIESISSMAGGLSRMPEEDWSAPVINDLAREILLSYVAGEDNKLSDRSVSERKWPVPVTELFGKALDLLRGGIEMFPRFLALQFNLMRALYHCGHFNGHAEAREIAIVIASSQESDWDIGPLDDILPNDFFPEHFDYRTYFDLGVKVLGEGRRTDPGFFRLIRASAAHYASMVGGPVGFARAAADLDPEFPLFRIELARLLATDDDTRREAAEILAGLAGGDILPLGAWDELQNLKLLSELPPEAERPLSQRIDRIRARIDRQPA